MENDCEVLWRLSQRALTMLQTRQMAVRYSDFGGSNTALATMAASFRQHRSNQYAAVPGRWLGVTNSQLNDVFPDLASFGFNRDDGPGFLTG